MVLELPPVESIPVLIIVDVLLQIQFYILLVDFENEVPSLSDAH